MFTTEPTRPIQIQNLAKREKQGAQYHGILKWNMSKFYSLEQGSGMRALTQKLSRILPTSPFELTLE